MLCQDRRSRWGSRAIFSRPLECVVDIEDYEALMQY
jgi:hypothetical protein